MKGFPRRSLDAYGMGGSTDSTLVVMLKMHEVEPGDLCELGQRVDNQYGQITQYVPVPAVFLGFEDKDRDKQFPWFYFDGKPVIAKNQSYRFYRVITKVKSLPPIDP